MLAYFFVLIAVATRLLPHPFHFTMVGAALLYFGARRSRKEMMVPVVLLALSDVYLTTVRYGFHLSLETFASSLWYAAAILIGSVVVRKTTVPRVLCAALASSISFFIFSNFMVWAVAGLYAHSWAGLAQCYVMAIPFFRNTFTSDLVLTPIAFSIPIAASALMRYAHHTGNSQAAA